MVDDKATTINALIEAVEAIEMELGITPSGVYSDVRVRMDILESRIQFSTPPGIPNDGYVKSPLFIVNDTQSTTLSISDGYGAPTENRLNGSLYMRGADGYANNQLYIRLNNQWNPLQTEQFKAANDLAPYTGISGNFDGHLAQTVIGLQNRPFASTPPIDTPAGDGYVISWNSDGYQWEPQVGFYAAGDLDGYKDNQTVINIQGYKVLMGTLSSTTDGYSLIWNNGSTQWEPQRLAAVFSPLNDGAATNIRSNRYLKQSPVNDGYVGIVNFSSDSVQITSGVAANYAAIVGGDQNTITGDYGFIGGGLSNTIIAPNSVIVGGTSNSIIANSDLSFIGSGNANVITGDRSVIVGGDTNSIAGTLSSILGGAGNVVNSDYSVILSGIANVVALSGQHNIILGGSDGYIMSGIHSTIINGTTNTTDANYVFIGGGSNNSVSSNLSSIINGNNNSIATGYSYTTILNGDHNSVTGDNNTLLNGSLNTITASGVVTLGGISNNITSNRVLVFGNGNTLTAGSDFSTTFGAGNAVADGYSLVHGLLNTASVGSTYVNIYGNNNLVGSSTHVGVWGSSNTVVNTSPYSFIFGDSNTINTGSDHARIFGSSNIVGTSSPYALVAGTSNVIGNTTTSSLTAGANIANSGSFSGAIGKRHSVSSVGVGAFVHGQFARAINAGQYSHANTTFTANTPGSAQFARVIMTGSGVAGSAISLTTDGSANLVTEDGYAYDMTIRVLINNTTGTLARSRYVFDVLAHCESGVLTLDAINTTISNNSGPVWNVSLSTSTNQLIISVDSFGGDTRRAVATVDWREITRL